MPASLHDPSQSSQKKYVPSVPPSGSQTRGGGPISELQEYVQSDRRFPVSSNQPVLKWDWDHRMANAVTLEFRATVSFLLSGVPHHAAGAWHTSKKASQRDAAERVLVMIKSQDNNDSQARSNESLCTLRRCLQCKLEAFYASLSLSGEQKRVPLQWLCFQPETGGYQASVEVCLFGNVVHTLQGAACGSEQKAYEDTANRALWYLKAPGHLNAFEASYDQVVNETLQLPAVKLWLREGHASDSELHQCEAQQRAAQQKTMLMRVQNQLQRKYGKILPSGTPVWKWTFEHECQHPQTSEYQVGQHLASALKNAQGNQSETAVAVTPEPCRATVWIAGVDREFQGEWCQGQKAAQLNACAIVTEFLENELAFGNSESRL